jgi:hypothetical protein
VVLWTRQVRKDPSYTGLRVRDAHAPRLSRRVKRPATSLNAESVVPVARLSVTTLAGIPRADKNWRYK